MKIEKKLSEIGLRVLSPIKDQRDKGKICGYFCVVPFDKIQYGDYYHKFYRLYNKYDLKMAKKRVEEKELHFKPPLALVYRPSKEGNLWGVEHRRYWVEAMVELGHKKFYANVLTGLTYRQEIELFFHFNSFNIHKRSRKKRKEGFLRSFGFNSV